MLSYNIVIFFFFCVWYSIFIIFLIWPFRLYETSGMKELVIFIFAVIQLNLYIGLFPRLLIRKPLLVAELGDGVNEYSIIYLCVYVGVGFI